MSNTFAQLPNEKVLLQEYGFKVTGGYELISEGEKDNEYKVYFNYENTSGFELEYSVTKIKNEDGSYRLGKIGNNFLKLKISNAKGLNKLPILVFGEKSEEISTEPTQKFKLIKDLSESYSKIVKIKKGEEPELEAKIVQKLEINRSDTEPDNLASSNVEKSNDVQEEEDEPKMENDIDLSTSYKSNCYENAFASDVELTRIMLLDSSNSAHSVIFDNKRNRLIYSRSMFGRKEIAILDLEILAEVDQFSGGSVVKAISPDGNRIFYDSDIYDLKERKNYRIGVQFTKTHYGKRGKTVWIEKDRIISYLNEYKNGKLTPITNLYEYLDLNDLQIRPIPREECYNLASSIEKTNGSYHKNIYLEIGKEVIIHDRNSSYKRTLIPYSSSPIWKGWSSANYKYFAISHSVVNDWNKLVLYELKYKGPKENMMFSSSNPYRHFSDSFKREFDKKNGVGIFATVYEAKVNPLNDKIVGPDRNKHVGELTIAQVRGDGKLVYRVSRDDYGKTIKAGYIASNFRVSLYNSDENGAWTILNSLE